MKPEIKIKIYHYPGYGGPESWDVCAYWENLLLDSKNVGSEMDVGDTRRRFLQKWSRVWSKKAWQEAIRGKKKASELCVHCGSDTIDGVIYCVEKVFCKNCEPFIEQYKKEYQDKVEAGRLSTEAREAKRRQQDHDEVDAKISGAFHWKDNWFFKRQPDGSVVIAHLEPEHYLIPELTIPPNEWASIVCSVSAGGETAERWQAQQDFHGRQP
jgi:hypothetical protein